MLAKCANPECSAPFRYLHQGKLFQIEVDAGEGPLTRSGLTLVKGKPPQRVEYFWLCDTCARTMTMAYQKGAGARAIRFAALRAAS